MNLNILHTFQVLAETLSFTEAARRLHTVQPAISRQIKSLEDALGYPLFDRSRKKVALTPEGQRLLERIAFPLRELDSAIKPQVSKNEPEGDLLIGSIHEAGAIFLWPKLLELQKRFPKIKTHLTLSSSKEIVSMLQSGLLQVGFVSSVPKSKAFEISAPLSESAVLIQSKKTVYKHWLKRDEFDFVTYRTHDPFTDQFLKAKMPKKLRDKVRERAVVNSHIAMIHAVVTNDWLAVLPRSSAVVFAKENEIEIIAEEKQKAGLHLICTGRFLNQKSNQVLWREILTILKSEKN